MNKLAGALAAAIALYCGACGRETPKDPSAPATDTPSQETSHMEWKGQFCAINQGGHRLATSPEEWLSAWAALGQTAPAAPDFSQHFAVFVFLGQRNTGGYGVKWLETTGTETVLNIRYQETKPSGMTMQVITQPFAVHIFPRTGRQIKVEKTSD